MTDHISTPATAIESGRTALGIEFGSTNIKAVLIDDRHHVLASGSAAWENQFVDRVWTYSLEAVTKGLQACYASLTAQIEERYGIQLRTLGGLGVSAMMHGYLAFDREGQLLTPFRTWRNTSTGPAAQDLSNALDFNVPMRWSIAHLYQAILNDEEHLSRLAHLTTLAGYVHWKLTGERVLGVGDASGMFPIDSATGNYDTARLERMRELVARHGFTRPLTDLLPRVAAAGEAAGELTADGALDRALLAERVFNDPDARGTLEAIMLPQVAQTAAQRMEAAAPGGVAVYDVPLLVEEGMEDLFDCVLVIETPPVLRLARLQSRGLSRQETDRRMAGQADDEERRRVADVLLLNNGAETDLADGVDWLWEHRIAVGIPAGRTSGR